MESAKPSAGDVAAKIFGKSGIVTRSRSMKKSVATPSEDTTPRTLIGGILDATSISKSGLVGPRTRKSKLTKTPITGPSAKRKKALRQSLGDNATPKTIISNLLMEASPETPLEVPLKLPEKILPDETESDSINQSLPDDMQPQASLSEHADSEDVNTSFSKTKEIPDHQMDSFPSTKERESALGGEEKGENNASRKDSMDKDNAHAKGLSPGPVNAEVDTPELSPEIQSGSSRATTDDEESQSDGVPVADIINPSVDDSSEPSEKRRWKELKTPHELPIRRNVLSEKQMAQEDDDDDDDNSNEESERTSKAAKKPPPGTKRTIAKSDTNLPSSLVKSIFQHFSKSRISRNTLNSIERGSSVFFKQISSDLMAYSKHAGRGTIEFGDVELLMRRQGFINDKQSLNSLIEKYLPLEYRQELIPVVQSGNNVVLKKSN